jgi:hypothetical protein
MKLPVDSSLPFFAYGIFQPGELAFLQIKEFVFDCRKEVVSGQLKVRDGLPIAAINEDGHINGTLIFFRPDTQDLAYQRIAALEPEKQYWWSTQAVESGQIANLLAGVSPNKGAEPMDWVWEGRQDPLFTAALEVVEETLAANSNFADDLKPLFHLEMAYLLLWTAIERYASLRYHLQGKATDKVLAIANERAFAKALQCQVTERRHVQRADAPTKRCTLDPNLPADSLKYFYQVRSNLVHRGKGAHTDHARLEKSLRELLPIFKTTLAAAFEESTWPGAGA